MQRELVVRAIDGDRDAFADIIEASLSRQYAVAALILGDGDRAQDAVQEALVSAWRGLSALREPDAWEAWLHRLTVRACFRHVRRESGRRLVELHVAPDPEPGAHDLATAGLADRDRLERALDCLPIEQRAIVVLHHQFGYLVPEVAAILDIPLGTAKSRLHRGLETLRAALSAETEALGRPAMEGNR
jgi:RNA polymerase sigma-70 factor (ECF subfamily)